MNVTIGFDVSINKWTVCRNTVILDKFDFFSTAVDYCDWKDYTWGWR